MNRTTTLVQALCWLLCAAGCSDAPGGEPDDPSTEGTRSQSGPADAPADASPPSRAGAFDLAEYMFHEGTNEVGESATYTVNVYARDGGGFIIASAEETDRRTDDTITLTVAGELNKSFVIRETVIEEILHDLGDVSRDMQRFVDVGTTYLDARHADATLGIEQSATCSVVEHLDELDLSGATGEYELASGTYEDVLHVQCATGFVVGDAVETHTELHHYFARGWGAIFQEGTVLLLGDVYFITEF